MTSNLTASMKKSLRFLAAAIAIVAAAASCAKENAETGDNGAQPTKSVTFTAAFPETKAGFDGETGKMTWEPKDQILINDGYYSQIVTLTEDDIDETGRSATFTISEISLSSNLYSAAFPARDASIDGGVIIFSDAGTCSSANDAFRAYAYNDGKTDEKETVELVFNPAGAIVRIETDDEYIESFGFEALDASDFNKPFSITDLSGSISIHSWETTEDCITVPVVDGVAYVPITPSCTCMGYVVTANYTTGAVRSYTKEFDDAVSFEQGMFYNIAGGIDDNLVCDGLANLKKFLPYLKEVEPVEDVDDSIEMTVKLNSAVVTYAESRIAYIEERDEAGASIPGSGCYIYKQDHGYKAGDCFSGLFVIEIKDYNGFPEIVNIEPVEGKSFTTEDAFIPETTVTIERLLDNFEDYVCMRVKVEAVTFEGDLSSSSKSATITQDAKSTTAYWNNSNANTTKGAVANIIGYPLNFKGETKEINLYESPEVVGGPSIISVSATSKSVKVDGTATVEASINTEALISAEVGNRTIADASFDELSGVLTITGLAEGKTTVTLSASGIGYYSKPEDVVIEVTVEAANSVTTWVKVTSEPTDWSGEYLLVYENEGTGSCWTGVDAANCYANATISSGSIAAIPDGAATLIVAPMEGGYSIKVSGGDNNGKFICGTSGSNTLNFNSSAALNTLSYGDGVVITSNTSVMRYNSASNNNRFRYYKSSSYTGQKAVQLFKKTVK